MIETYKDGITTACVTLKDGWAPSAESKIENVPIYFYGTERMSRNEAIEISRRFAVYLASIKLPKSVKIGSVGRSTWSETDGVASGQISRSAGEWRMLVTMNIGNTGFSITASGWPQSGGRRGAISMAKRFMKAFNTFAEDAMIIAGLKGDVMPNESWKNITLDQIVLQIRSEA